MPPNLASGAWSLGRHQCEESRGEMPGSTRAIPVFRLTRRMVAMRTFGSKWVCNRPTNISEERPMSNERVRVSIDGLGIAEVALARADKMNALDPAMFDALLAAIDRLHREAGLRAVLLHGEGGAFCAGLDMA